MAELIPDDFAIDSIDRQQSPFLRANICGRFDVTIKSHLQISFARKHGRGDVNAVAPNNRRGVAQSRDLRLPSNVFIVLDLPLDWRGGVRVEPAGLWTAKLGPIGGGDIKSNEG